MEVLVVVSLAVEIIGDSTTGQRAIDDSPISDAAIRDRPTSEILAIEQRDELWRLRPCWRRLIRLSDLNLRPFRDFDLGDGDI